MAYTPVATVRIDPAYLDEVREILDLDHNATNSQAIRAAVDFVRQQRHDVHRRSRLRKLANRIAASV